MCEHEHLKTIGHRLFCKDCGEELPLEFLTQEKKTEEKPKPRRKKKEVSE